MSGLFTAVVVGTNAIATANAAATISTTGTTTYYYHYYYS
jgi:hypothetical protein